MNSELHEGRRARQKERFSNYGLDNFSDAEALELLLYYAVPRRDTNELAHRLLKRFGSFSAVLEADALALSSCEGMGEAAASFITLVREINRRYLKSEKQGAVFLGESIKAGEFCKNLFSYESEEKAYLLTLSPDMKLIRSVFLGGGTSFFVDFPVREIVSYALNDKAAGVILCHNHLTGSALPSQEDENATLKIASALSTLDIILCDHIIVSEDRFVSMRGLGMIK